MDLSNKPFYLGDRESEQAWLAASREQMTAFMSRALGPAAQPLIDGIESAGNFAQLKREAMKCAWILSKKAEPEHLEAFRLQFATVMA
jgi:hypothetical protein